MYDTIKQSINGPKHIGGYVPDTDGLYLEFGVATGGTITIIANHTANRVYGFDSFIGLQEKWNGYEVGHFSCDMPKVPSNVTLIEGMFEDTLPKFMKKHKKEKVAFLHVDCDLYSSTKCVFDNLKNNFKDGSIICFDELIDYAGEDWRNHEWKAWHEFLEETKYNWECLGLYGVHQVAFRIFK
jgi:hypothetical protein